MSKSPDVHGHSRAAPVSVIRRYGVAFGRFWWDFLVGDTPELLIGAAVAVIVVALLAHHGVARAVTVAVMPVLVIALLVTSVRRAPRPPRPPRP